MKLRRASPLLLLLLPCLRVRAADAKISEIDFVGNRTEERILRRRIPFTEGDTLHDGDLSAARKALFEMRLFKQVFVSSSTAADGGARVQVVVDDGWYLVPFPFYVSGSGGSRGGMVLSERNVLRQAEGLTGMGFFGSSGGRGSLWTSWEGWSAEASYGRSEFVERSYADGGFTASAGFHRPLDENDFSHFGIVTGLHEKTVGEGAFALGFPRRNGVTLRGGWEPYRVRYENALGPTPDDGGRLDRTFVEVRMGFLDREGFGDLGALLGFGLADLEERLKPLAVPKTQFGSGLTVRRGDNWTGSGKSYTTEIINSRLARSWGGQNKLSLSASAGAGENLPNSLEIATGRDLGLMGQYAREFRGREAAAATLSYSRPFRLTHRGVWQGMVFAEAARAWDGEQRTKEGVGASFYYRFWRFPLPFGFTVTRSLDDHNTQVSAAVGGRF